MRNNFLSISCLLFILFSFTSIPDHASARTKLKDLLKKPQDKIKNLSFDYQGENRNFRLAIPKPGKVKEFPVIFVFHGGGGNGAQAASSLGVEEAGLERGFVVVHPDGLGPRLGKNVIGTWNVGFGWGKAQKKNINESDFFLKLLAQVNQHVKIDPRRIYLTGLSNGACLSYLLGSKLSGLVAAIAPVAGTIGGKENESAPLFRIEKPEKPLPVLIVHGMQDLAILYHGGKQKKAFPLTEPTRIMDSVPECAQFWVTANGCEVQPKVEQLAGGEVVKFSYLNGKDGSEVILYALPNGGHAWPGSKGDRLADPPSPHLNATSVILDFFSRHSR